ncbi:Hypothetical predicted protein [Podarcis lilfordi]|uniref:Uncharacterized protein n=1 Tax=Podarcis lilfordi TaxID=74358 RepID=A0AA35JR99_9SAUR|nr:Hypothetical predicted protein [Podarcis lilfordi]
MGSDESGQAVRSHPIPHREQRGSDISLSAHSAETELSSAGSAGISGSIPAEQRTVRNVRFQPEYQLCVQPNRPRLRTE